MGNTNGRPETLAQVRERKGLTQNEVARRLKVTQGFVSKVENGIEFPTENIERWVKVYGTRTQKEFRRLWSNSFQLPLWRDFAVPEEPVVPQNVEGLMAVIYDEAKVIGETEMAKKARLA